MLALVLTLAAPAAAEDAAHWTGNKPEIKPASAVRTSKKLRWKRPSKSAAAEASADGTQSAADEVITVSHEEPAKLPPAEKKSDKKSTVRIIRVQQLEQAPPSLPEPEPAMPEPALPEPAQPTFDLPDQAPPELPADEQPPATMPESQPAPPAEVPWDEPPLEQAPAVPPGEDLRVQGPDVYGPCPTPRDVKPITQITNSIEAEGGKFPPECTLGDEEFVPRCWAMTTYTWKASGLCHKPLYFEEVNLERYGHSISPVLQPIISGAHFFATIPVLPYKMGIETPCECVYPLGYYRPGSCAPHLLYPFPLSLRGALVEGAVATGLVFLIP